MVTAILIAALAAGAAVVLLVIGCVKALFKSELM